MSPIICCWYGHTLRSIPSSPSQGGKPFLLVTISGCSLQLPELVCYLRARRQIHYAFRVFAFTVIDKIPTIFPVINRRNRWNVSLRDRSEKLQTFPRHLPKRTRCLRPRENFATVSRPGPCPDQLAHHMALNDKPPPKEMTNVVRSRFAVPFPLPAGCFPDDVHSMPRTCLHSLPLSGSCGTDVVCS